MGGSAIGAIAEPTKSTTKPGIEPGASVLDASLLGLIVDAVADGITVQGLDGRVVLANRVAARAAGYDSPQALLDGSGDPVRARFEIYDEAREPISWLDLPGSRVLRGDPPSTRVIGFLDHETGGQRWSRLTATPVRDAAGAVAYAVNVFHDITTAKEAEEELRVRQVEAQVLLERRLDDEIRLAELVTAERARSAELDAIIGAIGEGIVVVDPDGCVALANHTAEELLGPQISLAGDRPLERLSLPEGMDLAGLVAHDPIQTRRPGSEGRWLELAAYPVRGPEPARTTAPVGPEPADGSAPAERSEPPEGSEPAEGSEPDRNAAAVTTAAGSTILVLRDITEAREREQSRDAFIGVLSHELRTPVTTIYAGAKVLARSETTLDDAARLGIFEDIHLEAERLHRLVEDVVALTRFGEGALEIGNEPVLLQRVLPAVVRSEEGRWPGGSFEIDLWPDLPPVGGEATYVEQVVRNLLANAMKYGGPDSTARISAVLSESEAEVEVRVVDEGPGFPEDEAPRLFDLYYRSPSVARKVSGSGIGLFVCARLIDAMGGHIWALNRPDGGAQFGFALKVMSADR